ncbi:MAG: ATP-binding protein [Steroidobacteraceae bacterium]
MKPRLTTQLFVAILATSVITAVLLGAAAHLSFTRGFVGYLNEQGIARAESVLPALTDEYRKHGSWDFIRGGTRQWFRMLGPRPADPLRADDTLPPPNPVAEPDLTGIALRISLLDAERKLVVGQKDVRPDAIVRNIEVDGKIVGYLALLPFERATGAANERFQKRQLLSLWAIGAFTALLAAAVAFSLSRILLQPVKLVAQFTHRLAGGDYGARVPVTAHHEIGQLMQDFNSLALTLERNEASRRQFVADVSHELRTPLAILRGELEAIEDGVRKLTPESLRSLQSETTLLGKLIHDLYDLSLSDVGALSYRKVDLDLGELLRRSIESFRDRMAQRSLTLATSVPPAVVMVFADEGRLQQLFGNLLENAARYTDAGGCVRVRMSIEADQAVVCIDDSPPGVAEEVRSRMFERFYRVEGSRNRAHGGAGLGLAICRSIVEAHGGTIAASDSEFGGVTMTVLLPLSRTMVT